MGFVKEQILKADRDKYGIIVNFRKTWSASWVIDRERDIWLRVIEPDKEPRGEEIKHDNYDFYWKGTLMELRIFTEGSTDIPAKDNTLTHTEWRLRIEYMDIPDSLMSKSEEILKDFYEAVYADYTPSKSQVWPDKTISVIINSDRAGKREYLPKDRNRPEYERLVNIPVKGFVEEYIHDEDYEKYGLKFSSNSRIKDGDTNWVVDREKNIWLRLYRRSTIVLEDDRRVDGPDFEWVFYWKGVFIPVDTEDICVKVSATDRNDIYDMDWHFKVKSIEIPAKLDENRVEILDSFRDAVTAYRHRGGKVTVQMDV